MTLGEISVFIRNGVTIKQNNQEKSGYPITRIETISDGTIDENRMGYAGIFEKEKYQNWFLENEDILISHINSEKHLGKSAIYFGDKEKIIHGMNLLCFRTKKEIVISQYLYFYFKSLNYRKNIGKIAKKSVNQASFSIKDFRDIEIDLPNIESQRKIVKKLKTIYEILKLKEEQVKNLSKLSKCLFFEMFGDLEINSFNWKKINLKQLSILITKGASPNWQGYSYVNDSSQTLFITSENVGKGFLELEKRKYVQDELSLKQKRSVLLKEDFLINIVGASIGRVAQFNLSCKANINQAVALVRIKKNIINSSFLLFYLNSQKAMNMYNSMQVSVARANLSLKNIEDLEIFIPPIELQNKFAERIKLIEKSKFFSFYF